MGIEHSMTNYVCFVCVCVHVSMFVRMYVRTSVHMNEWLDHLLVIGGAQLFSSLTLPHVLAKHKPSSGCEVH
jgi:hypothetical protein